MITLYQIVRLGFHARSCAVGRIRIPPKHFLMLISMEAGSGSTTASGRRAVVAESNSAGFLTALVLNRVHGNPAILSIIRSHKGWFFTFLKIKVSYELLIILYYKFGPTSSTCLQDSNTICRNLIKKKIQKY